MSFKLYKIINTVDQKIFIGITELSLDQKWEKHVKDSNSPLYPLHCAIQQYGKDKFIIELIEESDDRNYIRRQEVPTIVKYNASVNRNGYNIVLGEKSNSRKIIEQAF